MRDSPACSHKNAGKGDLIICLGWFSNDKFGRTGTVQKVTLLQEDVEG